MKRQETSELNTICVDVTGNHLRMPGSGNVVTRMVLSTHIIWQKTNIDHHLCC